MDTILAKNLADGYRVGAIIAPSDAEEWLGCLANDMDWQEWLDLPVHVSAEMRDTAMLAHIPSSPDEPPGAATLSDGSVVTLRKMRTRDRVGIREENPVERDCVILSRVSGLTLDKVRNLPVGDYLRLLEAANDFA